MVGAALAACSSDPTGVNLRIDRPAALFAEALSLYSVRLSWPRSGTADVIHYVLERREQLSGPFEELTQVTQAASDSVLFFDGTVQPETIYGYRVIAVDRFGERSAPSVVAGVATPYWPGVEMRVTTTAAGAGFTDPDGYLGVVEGPQAAEGPIGSASPGVTITRRFSRLAPGSYRVVLRGLSANCEFAADGQAAGDSTRTVTVTDQGVETLVVVSYTVECRDPSRGEIIARVTVTGGDVDSSGFSLVATGQAADQTLPDSARIFYRREPLNTPAGGVVGFENLRVGSYQVELDSVAANCTVRGDRIVPVEVTALARDTVSYLVDCPLGDIPDVPDPARPFVIRNAWTPAEGPGGSTVRLDLRTDFSAGASLAVGDLLAVTSFDPTVVRIDSIVAASPWTLTSNIQPGAVAWLLLNSNPAPITAADLVRIYFTAVGAPGATTRTATVLQSLSNEQGDPRQDSARVVEARFRVTSGGGGGGNLPPVAEANGPYSGSVGNPIGFSAAGSLDSDGTIVSYSWNWGDQSAAGSGASPAKAYAAAGTYAVTLTVTDDDGATDTDQATVTVTGAGANQPPVAEAGGPYTGTVGNAITFTAAGSSDPDGTITAYDWNFGDNTTGTGASVGKIYAAPGTYTAMLTVRDNGNLTDTDQAQVTVSAPPPVGPLVWRNAFGPITPSDSLVQLVITYDLTTDIPQTTGPEAVGTVIVDSLKWNPALLAYVAFNWGPGFSGSVNSTGASTNGRIRFSAAQGVQGAAGVVTIATITFKAIGPAGNTVGTSTFLGGLSSSVASGAVNYLPHTGRVEGFLTLSYTGPQASGTVSGTVTVTGQASSLAGVGFTVDPTATGAATVSGALTGSGTSFAIPPTLVHLGSSSDPGFGSGQVTLGSLPAGCGITSPAGGVAAYSGLTAGGSTTVSFTVDCQPPPPPAQRYLFRSTWGPVSGGTVDLVIAVDPSGFNDPAIHGAGPDGFSGLQAVQTLTGSAAGRLTAVTPVAVAPFATATVGGALPALSWITNTTAGDRTSLVDVARFRFTVAAGAPGPVTTATTVQEISTGNGDAFNLVFSGAGQNIDVVETTLELP
jgi:PKD repeat protein